jgi:hypothetical protein
MAEQAAAGQPCQECDPACQAGSDPSWSVYGDFLYIRAANAEVPYALAFAPAPTPQPALGPISVVDPDYNPGFRVGFERKLNETSSIGGNYTFFYSREADATTAPGGEFLLPLVMQPNTGSAGLLFDTASASLDVNFQRVNIDYRSVIACGQTWSLDMINGVSYAHLSQDFTSTFIATGIATTNVISNSNFDGGGIHVGLDVEKHACNTGFMAYGHAMASFLAGEFENNYLQAGTLGTEVNTSWKAGRVVTILDLETGFGWANAKDTIRVTGGYMFNGWFNVVSTNQFINAVQSDNFTGLSDALSFDGFVGHVELRF